MRRIRFVIVGLGALGTLLAAAVVVWRRNPRLGSGIVNAVVNPRMIRRGFAGSGGSEIGTLEHIGRRSGLRRLTPVHPEPTPDGFRIIVPLGTHSEWARNVLAAGHCRLQLHDVVYDLDEPRLVAAGEIAELPAPVRGLCAALGFDYLLLHQFASTPGTLAEVVEDQAIPLQADLPSEGTRPLPVAEVVSAAH
jgi:deazaflavin-dependent oxidoreductase (nitroreductase family)